ncbi:MAG: 50S ribosomal protein L31e [Thermoprotei archaeon]|nr:MAG: 50S ribosomal protein L31e [Thermoprotei archaeon]
MSEQVTQQARTYVIPLYRVYWGRRKNRAKRAIRLIREFVKRHIKKAERIVIDNKVNEYVWSRGIEKPPRRIKVSVLFDEKEKIARVTLAEK